MLNPFADRVRIRSCGLLVQNQEIVLVQQRVPTRTEPVWIPPGGGVQLGENTFDALKREVFEETHLRIQSARLKYIHEFIEVPYHAMELYFLVEEFDGELNTGGDPEFTDDNQQIIECRFLKFDEIKSINLTPEFLKNEIANRKILTPGIAHHKSV